MIPAYPQAPGNSEKKSPEKVSFAWIVCLLLAYTAAAQFASWSSIDRLVTENAEYNQFSSEEALLTFLRMGVIIWSILASFLQAVALRLLYRGIVQGHAPTLRASWFWVLVGQIPFMLTVLVMGLLLQSDAVAVLGQTPLRMLFGAIGASIYIAFAKKAFGPSTGRLVILFAIVTIINSLLLVSGSSA